MTPLRACIAVVLSASLRPAVADAMRIEVHAVGDCPSGEAVQAELGRIAADHDETMAEGGRADIFESPRGVRIRLHRPSDGAVTERAVDTAADCEERALAAAVVLASWQADLRSEVRLELVGTRPSWPSWFPSAGVAGVGVVSDGGGWAAGAALDFQVAHRSGWGARIAGWGTGFRAQSLGNDPGRASWTRLALGIGPIYGIDRKRWIWVAAAQLALARITVRGDNFLIDREDAAVDLGARLAFEAGFRLGAFAPCVGLAVIGWPRTHRAVVLGVAGEKTLPKLDLLLAVGIRWGRGP
jgi:hypothetical protein